MTTNRMAMKRLVLFFAVLAAAVGVANGKDAAPRRLYPIHVNGQWGYIDKTGKFIIPPRLGWPEMFSEGVAAVKAKDPKGWRGQKWVMIDKTGKVVLEPKTGRPPEFRGGVARVRYGRETGYIDKTGEYIWKPTW